jgi:hypothetical protein
MVMIETPSLVPFLNGKGNEVRKIAQGYIYEPHDFNFSEPGFEQKC